MANYNFRAPALPVPGPEYEFNQQLQLATALRLYFNRLDTYNAAETTLNNSQNVMMWLGGFGGGT